jgi:Gly-Xaa carboxypeptidase
LSRRIFEKWGPDSIALIVDEGLGIEEQFGRSFALPLASEKGYFDLEITVHVPGGHSSLPPSHTSIGILAEAVTRLESLAETNFPFYLEPYSPFNTFLQCAAEDESTHMPRELRDAIKDPKGRSLVLDYITTDPIVASILRTTQAVTIFQGGNKANALPAYAYALVNYRIASSESLDEVRRKIIETLGPVASQFDLEYTWGPQADDSDMEQVAEIPEFTMALSWRKTSLEPSPVSPQDSSSWHYLSGVIKHVFDEPDEEVIVAPFYAVGNTDTRFYWDLSPQIYRFGAMRSRYDTNMGNIHDVNERVCRLSL